MLSLRGLYKAGIMIIYQIPKYDNDHVWSIKTIIGLPSYVTFLFNGDTSVLNVLMGIGFDLNMTWEDDYGLWDPLYGVELSEMWELLVYHPVDKYDYLQFDTSK